MAFKIPIKILLVKFWLQEYIAKRSIDSEQMAVIFDDVAKAAIICMTFCISIELQQHGIAAQAVARGLIG